MKACWGGELGVMALRTGEALLRLFWLDLLSRNCRIAYRCKFIQCVLCGFIVMVLKVVLIVVSCEAAPHA